MLTTTSPRLLPTAHAFDVVTARSFADVATTTRAIDALLAPSGVGLVSEPPVDRTERHGRRRSADTHPWSTMVFTRGFVDASRAR